MAGEDGEWRMAVLHILPARSAPREPAERSSLRGIHGEPASPMARTVARRRQSRTALMRTIPFLVASVSLANAVAGQSPVQQPSVTSDTVYAPSACPAVTLPASADAIDKLVIERMRT